jgi:hypothetical protein
MATAIKEKTAKKAVMVKTNFDTLDRLSGGDTIIDLPLDSTKHVVWEKEGSSRLHLIKFNIAKHYPMKFISLDMNPRQFQRRGNITNDILETLSSEKVNFSEVSHPVHWVGSVSIKDGRMSLKVESIMDGGHRHLSILDAGANNILRGHHTINVFVYENYEPTLLKAISKGLNSNRSPKDKTLMNFDHLFDMFKKACPVPFEKGYIEVMENQPDTKFKVEDMAILTVAGDPSFKDSLNGVYNRRQPLLDIFAMNQKEYAKRFPKETVALMFQIYDYIHLYMADVFSESHPHLMKRIPVGKETKEVKPKKRELSPRKKHLVFIDKVIPGISEKTFVMSVFLGVMHKKLVDQGGKLVWPKNIKDDPEKYCRKLIYTIGGKVGKIIGSNKRFGSATESWQKIVSLI